MARQTSGKKKSWLPTIVAVIAVLGIFGGASDKDVDKEQSTAPEDPPNIEETVETTEADPDAASEDTTPVEIGSSPEAEPVEAEPVADNQPSVEPDPQSIPAPTAEQEPEPAPAPVAAETPKSRTVYVTKSGKCYHYSSSCNGAKYYESDLETAKSRGLSPCKKCVG